MIRVAGYCRVSTDRDDQANSFEAQQRYFREYIAGREDWTLFEIYADDGISGTSTKKRSQFNRMMNDAYAGKFQMIITKEVSRFSRNVLDTIAYTRELKALGIGVLFMTDRINTLDPEGEMLLSFLASMAQEESRKTSTRVVWGQTRQMERGIVFGRSLLGFSVKNGVLSVNPEEAELVRLIFHKYAVEQVSTSEIAGFLARDGYRTSRGSTGWKSAAVIKILKNEKYVGDLVQKKSFTPDFLTHKKCSNKGQVPLIRIENHHEAIISREVWNLTVERLRKNNKHAPGEGGHSNRYIFSGRIVCAQCGARFTARYRTHKDGTKIRRWCCPTAGCQIGKLVRDDDAIQMLKTAIGCLPLDFETVIRNVTSLAMDAILTGQETRCDEPERISIELQRIRQKMESMMDCYFAGEIPKEEMQTMRSRYAQQMDDLNRRLEKAVRLKDENRDSCALRSRVREATEAIVKGEAESEVFSKNMLKNLTVFPDRHIELELNLLPHIFVFNG